MAAVLLPCVYCLTRPAAPGEHLIPSALGRFPRSGVEKLVLCKRDGDTKGCNEELTGPLFHALLRRGPYSVQRKLLPRQVGRSARGRKRSSGPSYEAPKASLPGTGTPALVEVQQGGVHGNWLPQLIVDMKDGSRRYVGIDSAWTEGAELREAVKQRIDNAPFEEVERVHFIGDIEGHAERLIREAFPSANVELLPELEAGNVLDVSIGGPAEPDVARAAGLLAFHLFLAFYSARGGEDAFRGIRSVILGRRDPYPVVSSHDPATAENPLFDIRDERPDQQKHLLLVHVDREGNLLVDLCLFANWDMSPWWRVVLASPVAPGALPTLGVALAYYPQEQRADDGRILDGEFVYLRNEGSTIVVPAQA